MNKTKMKNGPWVFYEDVLVTEDIDECGKGTHQCSKKANCSNTPGSYNCQCQIGYEGNGKKCNDINECADSPCGYNANCTNTNGSYICECRTGYEGNGINCTDVDECEKGTHKCDNNANCTNTPGSFSCQCQHGYTGEGRKCEDVDECEKGTHKCDKNAKCTNTPGSFNCQCQRGYTGEGRKCEAECPLGWEKFDGLCFYISNGVLTSWNNAKDDCLQRVGHLAVPTNTNMNNYLNQAMKQHNVNAAWIGMYRKSGSIFYTVRDEEISYGNWNPGEPNNAGGNENCVEMFNGATGKWNDLPCSISRHYFCQRQL
ncbi:neurogenic locus notch homolog protein 1-like [Dendronephthya gigantea]|uniref:neurogenic locus notch homolog protein 1-like n=1 Tax=Dendronephthya gigantea TaxID=151771 RepID=UPI00106D1273|nr:neurogenic locus notch homolog protein 1-like [Dendronephthya gigantea]